VQIGRQNHPIDWVSTSPHLYLPGNDIQPIYPRFSDQLRTEYYSYGVQATKMKHTKIGHDVWVGHGAILKAGITVGNGAIIAAGAVVTKDVKPYSIVGGNPAKLIRYRIPEVLIESLMKTEWWNYSPKQLEKFQMHDIEHFLRDFNRKKISKKDIKVIQLGSFNFKGVQK